MLVEVDSKGREACLEGVVGDSVEFVKSVGLRGATALWSPSLNAKLDSWTSPLVLDGEYVHPLGKGFVEAVTARRMEDGGVLFDAPKIRLMADPTLEAVSSLDPVHVQATTYFDTVASNDLAGCQVTDQDGNTIYDGREWFAEHDRLLPLGSTSSSDHIGAQTLAVFADGSLVLTRQGRLSAQSAGLLAPSGSGSIDLSDLEEYEAPEIRGVVVAAGERELREECGLSPDVPIETRLTGFARMLSRGGKPEFFCLSLLGGNPTDSGILDSEAGLTDEIIVLGLDQWGGTSLGLRSLAGDLAEQSLLLALSLESAAAYLERQPLQLDAASS